tara:strand:- start:2995 stop:3711 length:717 start_codon:yes stop_codon:yes gene_type:complete
MFDNITPQIIDKPYKIWIIDNFLQKDVIKSLNKNWVSQDSGLWGSSYDKVGGKKNILEDGMRWLNDYDLMPDEISSVIKHFHSDEFTAMITKITGVDNLVTDKSRNWSGMRTMLPNSYQLIHSDARTHPKNGLRKELTCLFYLNEDYNRERDEGCLEIWNDDMTEKVIEVEPINNRFMVFLNSNTAYHGVPLVKSERRAITFSILKDSNSDGRTKALFVPREEDSDEVKEVAKKRLEV